MSFLSRFLTSAACWGMGVACVFAQNKNTSSSPPVTGWHQKMVAKTHDYLNGTVTPTPSSAAYRSPYRPGQSPYPKITLYSFESDSLQQTLINRQNTDNLLKKQQPITLRYENTDWLVAHAALKKIDSVFKNNAATLAHKPGSLIITDRPGFIASYMGDDDKKALKRSPDTLYAFLGTEALITYNTAEIEAILLHEIGHDQIKPIQSVLDVPVDVNLTTCSEAIYSAHLKRLQYIELLCDQFAATALYRKYGLGGIDVMTGIFQKRFQASQNYLALEIKDTDYQSRFDDQAKARLHKLYRRHAAETTLHYAHDTYEHPNDYTRVYCLMVQKEIIGQHASAACNDTALKQIFALTPRFPASLNPALSRR